VFADLDEQQLLFRGARKLTTFDLVLRTISYAADAGRTLPRELFCLSVQIVGLSSMMVGGDAMGCWDSAVNLTLIVPVKQLKIAACEFILAS